MNAMLEQIELPDLDWEEQVKRVEEKIRKSESTALKRIPESSAKACVTPSTIALLTPPRIVEEL